MTLTASGDDLTAEERRELALIPAEWTWLRYVREAMWTDRNVKKRLAAQDALVAKGLIEVERRAVAPGVAHIYWRRKSPPVRNAAG